jgi:hypothetical protein
MADHLVTQKILVFCSAGGRIRSLSWIDGLSADPRVRTALVYYGAESLTQPAGAHYFLCNRDFKIPNFLQLARAYPEVLECDLFLFIDDDIVAPAETIRRWCDIAIERHLDVCQPSLTDESKTDWPHVASRPHLGHDAGQFVEIQCFALSRRALRAALPYFFMVKTGTGLDLALFHLARERAWRTAVLHEVSVLHPRRPEDQTVRGQFAEFASFNQEMSRFLTFCFDAQVSLPALDFASNALGDTRHGVVRTVAIVQFVFARCMRVLRRTLGRR